MTIRNALAPAMTLCLALALVALANTPAAQAGKADRISKAFKGKILISEDALPAPDAADAAGTIKAYKAQTLKTITSSAENGVPTWSFHFTAFVKSKPKTGNLTLEFYTDDKEKLFVADKRLTGADPNLKILQSQVRISEDENLNRNRNYVIKLVANKGNKSVVLATTKIATK
jgi:hypothetical protein